MSSEKHAAALYRDFEKLYRLISLYKGNLRQIEAQVSYLENNLETHLRGGFGSAAAVKFDFLMSAVYYEGEEIFRSPTPEFTLSYALFCEGVKSIIFRGELSARELADWLLNIRSTLLDSASTEKADLASVLWRNSTPNIRVALYNSLISNLTGDLELDAADLDEEFEADEDLDRLIEKEALESEFADERTKFEGDVAILADDAWELPSGDLIIKKLAELGLQDPEVAQKLRRELSDAQVSDRAKRILKFSSLEVEHLRRELEGFDENQVEFNLLVRYLSLLEEIKLEDVKLYSSLAEALAGLIESILDRFHGGLILFLLKKIEGWKASHELQKVYTIIQQRLTKALQSEKNLLRIAHAFSEPSRMKVARQLVEFLGPKEFQVIMRTLCGLKRPKATELYLKTLIDIYPDLEQVPQIWRPEEIAGAIAILSNLRWEAKDRFLARCLRSKDPEIARSAGEQLATIHMDAQTALRLYRSLDDRLAQVWLTSLARYPVQEAWVNFVRLGLKENFWKSEIEEQSSLWIRVGLKYLGREAADVFYPTVAARRFFFWPKFPKLRASILEVALQMNEPKLKQILKIWIDSERSVAFQSRELKNLLSGRPH